MRREFTYALLLVLGAAVLRFWNLEQMEFKLDEREALDMGQAILQSRPWATAAHWPQYSLRSSGGICMAPLGNSLYALFWALTRSPLGCTTVIALLNVLSLPAIYLWVRRQVGSTRAMLTLGWVAFAPFAVIHSRKIWGQDLLLPGLALLLWGVTRWLKGKYWLGAGLLTWAALLVSHLHLSGPILLVVVAVVLGMTTVWRRWHKRWYRVQWPRWWELVNLGLALSALVFFTVPYLHYLATLSRHDFRAGMHMDSPIPEILFYLFESIVPFNWSTTHFGSHWNGTLSNVTWGVNLRCLLYVSLVGSIYTAIPLVVRGAAAWFCRPWRITVFGVSWIGFVLLFTFLRLPAYTHYILVMAPLPALIVAGAFELDTVRDRTGRFWHALRWTHIALLGMLSAAIIGWVSRRGGSDGDYGVSYGVRHNQAQALIAKLEGDNPSEFENGGQASLASGCRYPNEEVIWIVKWLAPSLVSQASGSKICEGWQPDGKGDFVFRWVLDRK
jgi:hypothetical protein